jgi:hypothetical protein
MKRRTGRATSQSTDVPLQRENVYLLKGSSGVSLAVWPDACSPWSLALVLQVSGATSLKQVDCSGGVVVKEIIILCFWTLQQLNEEGKKVSLINKQKTEQ